MPGVGLSGLNEEAVWVGVSEWRKGEKVGQPAGLQEQPRGRSGQARSLREGP